MKNYGCADIGGTNLKLGIINENLELVENISFKTPKSYDLLKEAVVDFFRTKNVAAVGICIPGTCSFGEIIFCPNLSFLNKSPLGEDVQSEMGVPVFLENDGNLAALGEYVLHEKDNIKNMVLITLGTGVGGGAVIDGKLFTSTISAFEAGHLVIEKGGLECGCGRKGCFEMYCSVSGLLNTYKELSYDKTVKSTGELIKLANMNDLMARLTFEKFADRLANGLADIANLLAPEKIKIGGGLSELSDYYLPSVIKIFSNLIYPAYKGITTIHCASSKNRAGMIGAAELCRQKLKNF